MAAKKHPNRGYMIFIIVMVILLIGAIALFVYGSSTNGIPQPKLPGQGVFALRTLLHHG